MFYLQLPLAKQTHLAQLITYLHVMLLSMFLPCHCHAVVDDTTSDGMEAWQGRTIGQALQESGIFRLSPMQAVDT